MLSWNIISDACVELISKNATVVGYIRTLNGATCGDTAQNWTVRMHRDSKCGNLYAHEETLELGRCAVPLDDPSTSYFASCGTPPRAELLPAFVQLKWTYDSCPWNGSDVSWFQFDAFRNVAEECVPWLGPTFRSQFAYMPTMCNDAMEAVRISVFYDANCTSFNRNLTMSLGDACEWNDEKRPKTTCHVAQPQMPTAQSSDNMWRPGGMSGGAIAGIIIVIIIAIGSFAAILISHFREKKAQPAPMPEPHRDALPPEQRQEVQAYEMEEEEGRVQIDEAGMMEDHAI